ncbi:1,4-dihydroxy-2-naphthoyl-CoA hydrolase MenI [Staphylococcus pettenkoferi]|uniref:Acyl-CoA thioesterase n=1 Tax=Staphylococcus pettenkoferi TaxID=170573 RepID=A0ABT4BJ90_9STAP|nr:thioesterase family protein [Staphylococcus pettenkoferi]ASE36010.1 acyl-CoA thioesterase [Staphylococcus pettenkoferi]EHM70388.1 acyl-CoA thioester hydrolase, YbgC/YbaW family [Staphylococcus pettenkoferi VCU012]MCY1564950.1 acyl-CoA thioesterase [Staphylococcus pettenkoferi]MCY1571813.1 acyl-CoA thioesterase [Staphylococcus pettenkoferi]MCY1580039.1 acyl-CoA thioesterase [Staphylococcus pettenkoferi]
MIYSITEIQARYQETDQMGVIYHGNYPTWFEVARTDYINKLGFSYKDMEDNGVISPVTELDIKYIKSVTYPEKVKIKTWVERYSRLKSIYCYEVYNQAGELATTGSTTLTCIRKDTYKPIRLDRTFPEWHEVYRKVAALNKEGVDFEVTNGVEEL